LIARTFHLTAIMFLVTCLAACSVFLPRGRYDERLHPTIVWEPGRLDTSGVLDVSRKVMLFEFTKPNGTQCRAVFPGETIDSNATCTDGTTAKVTLSWRNGSYRGTLNTGDGPVDIFFWSEGTNRSLPKS
jgi:hypothetical protein